MRRPDRSRPWICLALSAVIGVGMASRLEARHLPHIIGKEFGDALWAVMFFLIVVLIRPRISTLAATLLSLAVSFAIEFLKLYHAPWLDALRPQPVAGFLLGHAFLWRDFASYGMGAAAVGAGDLIGRRMRKVTG